MFFHVYLNVHVWVYVPMHTHSFIHSFMNIHEREAKKSVSVPARAWAEKKG